MPDELPKWFSSVLEAYAYADRLRESGEPRPLQVIPLQGGRAVLKYYDEGEQHEND